MQTIWQMLLSSCMQIHLQVHMLTSCLVVLFDSCNRASVWFALPSWKAVDVYQAGRSLCWQCVASMICPVSWLTAATLNDTALALRLWSISHCMQCAS